MILSSIYGSALDLRFPFESGGYSAAGSSRREPILNTASQATKRMMMACNMTTQSFETFLVNMSMNRPDLFNAPNNIAASKTPSGWFLPSKATAMPVNPYDAENPS